VTKELHVVGVVVVDNPLEEGVPLTAEGFTADIAGLVDVVDTEEHVSLIVRDKLRWVVLVLGTPVPKIHTAALTARSTALLESFNDSSSERLLLAHSSLYQILREKSRGEVAGGGRDPRPAARRGRER
jgi:hypothetical protein